MGDNFIVNRLIDRNGSVYSTVDGSRQGFFWLVGKKKIKNKIC